jgi:hypothetical protein
MTDQCQRDHQAEQDHAEFAGWAEAQGYDDADGYDFDEMEFAFTAGIQAARDLADLAEPMPGPDLGAASADLESEIRVAVSLHCTGPAVPCDLCLRETDRAMTAVAAYARLVAEHERSRPKPAPDRITEDTRAYVSTRAGGHVTAVMLQRRVRIGFVRAARELNRLADDHAIGMPDAKGRYTVPPAFVAATQTGN